ILFQQKGSGLSSAFGGEGNIYTTKRGLEKILFRVTIVLGILFLALSLLNLLLHK
ncbi:preprotein translocase subunit SecG, partial [Candidatus Giovannonibacteria bacterium RIFCSPLOWO2_12_43_8]